MSVVDAIPVQVYLTTVYRPDCDFVDGRIEERNLGELEHSTFQMVFAGFFYINRREWGVVSLPEQRVQVSPTRFRVPDVCVLRRNEPRESIIRRPPLICIEILSPEDTVTKLQARVNDYEAMGVENIWCIDPLARRAWVATAHRSEEPQSGFFEVPGTLIRIEIAEAFRLFDEEVAGT